MFNVNVKALKALIKGMPDNALVVVSAHDHSYRVAEASKTTAIVYEGNHLSEDFGDEHNEEGGQRVKVLLIS